MSKKFFSLRVMILIVALFLALLAISPSPWAEGVQIKHVNEGSPSATAGIQTGEILVSINNQPVNTLADYQAVLNTLTFAPVEINLVTDKGTFTYEALGELGFQQDNLSVIQADIATGIELNANIQSLNGQPITSEDDLATIREELFPTKSVVITTNKGERAFLIQRPLQIQVTEAQRSNINQGLELQGGTRVLLKPVSDEAVTDKQVEDLIAVLSNRLNVYGLADLKIRPANDLAGNKFVLIEIAGATREEVRELISKQGKFEAKIGPDVVFNGGNQDVPFVCRDDGSCSGIQPPCDQLSQENWVCTFQFSISLSETAATRHADLTRVLGINTSQSGQAYLSESLDLYLDDQLVDSLLIGSDLQGQPTTQISISGPGYGSNEAAAYDAAIQQMNKLQTILITGSLPLQLEVEKLDTVSPAIGQEFVKNAIFAGFAALIGVLAVMYVRYRRLKILIPVIVTGLSEIFLILGVAAVIRWNLDLAAIAGILAAVGTGVDDQIVIVDETMKGQKFYNWKEKIKRAFGIILVAYATTVVAMFPLWNAGAGLLRGFAVTTIIGVTIGVLITRPAFASMMEYLLEK